MNKLKISVIAFPGAAIELITRGKTILKNILSHLDLEITDQNPDGLFILTGGSENQAKNILKDHNRILILAMTENNSYAAATELKAFCNQNTIDVVLYNLDLEKDLERKLNYYITCHRALNKIKEYKTGLIGEVSEWLIASDTEKGLLKNKFGIHLEQIAWDEFPEFSQYPINQDFLDSHKNSAHCLEDSSKVYNLLHDIINQKKLNAITVECFPLVQENGVTACLALSKFNTDLFPAGCEGDITSITGKIITQELTGQIPWMANLAAFEEEEIFLAHCTIATDFVSDYSIKTHFETNKGTAIQGDFKYEEVTIFQVK